MIDPRRPAEPVVFAFVATPTELDNLLHQVETTFGDRLRLEPTADEHRLGTLLAEAEVPVLNRSLDVPGLREEPPGIIAMKGEIEAIPIMPGTATPGADLLADRPRASRHAGRIDPLRGAAGPASPLPTDVPAAVLLLVYVREPQRPGPL